MVHRRRPARQRVLVGRLIASSPSLDYAFVKGTIPVVSVNLPQGIGTSGSPVFLAGSHAAVAMHQAGTNAVYIEGWQNYSTPVSKILADVHKKLEQKEIGAAFAARMQQLLDGAR